MSNLSGPESYRAGIQAQRPVEAGGGACTLLVLRVGGSVVLSHHAAVATSAVLAVDEALELAGMLTAAAGQCGGLDPFAAGHS